MQNRVQIKNAELQKKLSLKKFFCELKRDKSRTPTLPFRNSINQISSSFWHALSNISCLALSSLAAHRRCWEKWGTPQEGSQALHNEGILHAYILWFFFSDFLQIQSKTNFRRMAGPHSAVQTSRLDEFT